MRKNISLLTKEQEFVFFVKGKAFASYRFAPDAGFTSLQVPGLGATLHNLTVRHGNVNGIGFGIEAGAGTIRSEEITARRGTFSVGFQQTLGWIDAQGTHTLTEQRTVRVAPGPSEGALLDITLDFTAPADRTVMFGQTEEAFLTAQMTRSLLPSGSGQLRNNLGFFGVEALHQQRAAWVGAIGVIAGETAGFVWMDHPKNFGHPALWAVSQEGDLALSPFCGEAKELQPGETLSLRYRLQVHRGYVEQDWGDARLAEYANVK